MTVDKTLRVLRRLALLNIAQTLEYRGAFVVLMINTVATPVISLLVWLTVSEQGVSLPLTRSQFVTYYLVLSVVSMLTATWQAMYVAEHIRLGGLSAWLLRPAHYALHDLGNNIGEKVVKLPLLLPLTGVALLLFRDDLSLPGDAWLWIGFLVALPLAAGIAFCMNMLLGTLAFWLEDVGGLVRLHVLVGQFLAGQFVPLALFPPTFAGALRVQPYRFTLSFPIELLTGRLSLTEIVQGFAWQTAYFIAFWLLFLSVWRRGLRSYAATGA